MPRTSRTRILKNIAARFNDVKVLVVGDLMLDQYTSGTASRISPEAPIPVLTAERERSVPGGAANTAHNIAALGGEAVLFGVTGDDSAYTALAHLLKESGVSLGGVVVSRDRPTTVKHRFVDGTHQLFRVDRESSDALTDEEERRIIVVFEEHLSLCDVVVFSDYAKGVFSRKLARALIARARKAGVPIIADVKPLNAAFFKGVDVVTPNLFEARAMSGADDIAVAGAALVKRLDANVIVTEGASGMSVFPKNGRMRHVRGRKVNVFDVSGAGDTVVAVIALAFGSGASLVNAAELANCAGGLVVEKVGVATLSGEELLTELSGAQEIEGVPLVHKLWGYEKWLENNEKYCCKILSLNKGYQCSLHKHKVKDEMFLVTKGHVRLEVGDRVYHMREGHFIRVEAGVPHRFRGVEDSTIIEVSTHHTETDSYRLEPSRRVVEEGADVVTEEARKDIEGDTKAL